MGPVNSHFKSSLKPLPVKCKLPNCTIMFMVIININKLKVTFSFQALKQSAERLTKIIEWMKHNNLIAQAA